MSSVTRRERIQASQARPLGARSRGNEEQSALPGHWPFYRAVTLLQRTHCPASGVDKPGHKGRADEMGQVAGPLLSGPQTYHGV